MIVNGIAKIRRAFRAAVALVCVLTAGHILSKRAESAILPLPAEKQDWSDMAFPSVTSATFTGGVLSLTTAAAGDLEIGSQFGPNNIGRHYGTGGTLGGPFSATLSVSGVNINSIGTVTNGGTVLVTYNTGAAGSVGTDYGIANGAALLQGTVLEVLLDGSGSDTLDVLYAITGGALQTNANSDPNAFSAGVGKYASGSPGLGLLRISTSNPIPNVWTGDFSFSGTTSLDAFGIPEPSALLLASFAVLIVSLSRSPRRL
jgi:hypothetical protein